MKRTMNNHEKGQTEVKKKLPASMTVEAALVMPIVLAALIAVMGFDMKMHDLVIGNMVTNEVTERFGHLPEERETTELEEYAEQRLRNTISGMGYGFSLEEYKNGSRAVLQGPENSRVLEDPGFRPEQTMRKITIIEGIMTE